MAGMHVPLHSQIGGAGNHQLQSTGTPANMLPPPNHQSTSVLIAGSGQEQLGGPTAPVSMALGM